MLAGADAGIVPMFPESCVGVPYKLADYAAAGLPVVNSLPGETEALLSSSRAGVRYTAGDVPSFRAALHLLPGSVDPDGPAKLAAMFDADAVYGAYVRFACGC